MAKSPPKSKVKAKSTPASKPSGLFKTRKTRQAEPQVSDTLTPPAEVAEAIDAFRECQEQARHFEGEATVHKDQVMEFCQEQYAERAMNGLSRSFKVLGDESMVTYVAMDSSAGITEDEAEAFAERWGKKAAEDLITRDLGSIRFDPEVLAANFEAVESALKVLPKSVLESLFKPMLLKAAPGAVEKAKQIAKDPEELRELIQQLKIKNYIR